MGACVKGPSLLSISAFRVLSATVVSIMDFNLNSLEILIAAPRGHTGELG
jgi:hypothetical protein